MTFNKTVTSLFLFSLAKFAFAAHPLVTDDTHTQDRGNSQVEINTDQQRLIDSKAHIGALTYTYGLRPELDIFSNLPVTFSTPSGRNDLSIGAKWRFWEQESTSFALKPELFLPTGDEDKGLGNGRTSMAMTLLASHEAAPWTFHGNLGLTMNRYSLPSFRSENRPVIWRASAAALVEINPKLSAVADTGIERNEERAASKNPAFFLLGFIYSPTKDIDLDIGIKFGLKAADGERQAGAGLTFRF